MATGVDRCFSAWRNGAMTSCEGQGGPGSYLFDEHSVSGFQVSQIEGEFRGEDYCLYFCYFCLVNRLRANLSRSSVRPLTHTVVLPSHHQSETTNHQAKRFQFSSVSYNMGSGYRWNIHRGPRTLYMSLIFNFQVIQACIDILNDSPCIGIGFQFVEIWTQVRLHHSLIGTVE